MGHYYTLGSELPDLKPDQSALVYSSKELWNKMQASFSDMDRKQMQLLFLNEDNHTLVKLLKGLEVKEDVIPVTVGVQRLQKMVSFFRENESVMEEIETIEGYDDVVDGIPHYMVHFTKEYIKGGYEDGGHFAEDILSVAYYNYLNKKANGFLKEWFDLNRMLANILAAKTAKKFDLDLNFYLIGDTPLLEILRQNSMSDVNALPNSEEVETILKIADEPNLYRKEKLLDEFRWAYLDEKIFADTFSMKAMISYYLKTRIIERWTMLDREQGEAAFRSMIKKLNKDGKEQLAAFVAKTKK